MVCARSHLAGAHSMASIDNATELDELARREIVERGVAPAAVVGVASWTGAGWTARAGAAGSTDLGSDASLETVFDLASVTKPFVAVCLARLVERGALEFETPLGALVPECRSGPSESATLELLGCHRAGFSAHGALFEPLLRGHAIHRGNALESAATLLRAECVGGGPGAAHPPVYSDLGYLLLGEALARAARMPLDELLAREVCSPIGSRATSARRWWSAGERFWERVAPTERVPFRGGLVRGVVHDENAWALSGHAVSGHAGLFGRVSDVLALGTALLDAAADRGARFLSRSTLERLVRERPGGTLRLGFDGKSETGSSAGPSAGPLTFGHLGFTGTSVWCDPAADAVTVLLTNRVCPTRLNSAIREARPKVHEALFALGRSLVGVGARDFTD
jgi:CubicO group peptidase (beta-lactamase class C family)